MGNCGVYPRHSLDFSSFKINGSSSYGNKSTTSGIGWEEMKGKHFAKVLALFVNYKHFFDFLKTHKIFGAPILNDRSK